MKQRVVALVLGTTGSGKSFYVKKILSKYVRVFIIDPRHEYRGDAVFHSFGSVADYFLKYEPDEFCCVCRFETLEEYYQLAQLAWIVEDCLVVFEEAELYMSSYDQDSSVRMLITNGRHRNISLVGVSQVPAGIDVRFRSVIDVIVCFQMREPRYLQWLSQVGFDSNEVANLSKERHEYVTIGNEELLTSS